MVPMILCAGQQRRHRLKEQTFGFSERRRGWDDVENSNETCTLPYVKWMTSVSSMHEAGHLKPVFCDNVEGIAWKGRQEGVQDGGDICIPTANSC